MGKLLVLFCAGLLLNSVKAAAQLGLRPHIDTAETIRRLPVLPQNFYSQNVGFFCKKEVQVQKAVSLPLYIRLGSKEYVDKLERKHR